VFPNISFFGYSGEQFQKMRYISKIMVPKAEGVKEKVALWVIKADGMGTLSKKYSLIWIQPVLICSPEKKRNKKKRA
jgi:hypothetical protein